MQVLFQTYSLAFQSPGGGERVMQELGSSLSALGTEVTNFEPWRDDPGNFDLRHYFSMLRPEAWRHAKRRWPHIPLVVTPTSFYGRDLATCWGLKKNRLCASLGVPDHVDLRSYTPFVDLFLPTTLYEADSLRGYFGVPSRKIEVVTNGLGAAFFEDLPLPASESAENQRPYVLHVGRFHPVKRQDFLIRTMRGVDADCVFLGGRDISHPEYLDHCQKLAATLLPGRCRFLTELPPASPSLAALYARAALFAFPSRFETFGLAALEALACGCPALLSTGMVSRDPFAGAADFLPPGKEALWRERIRLKLNEARRVDPSVRARIRATHDWRTIATQVRELYGAVRERKSSRSLPEITGGEKLLS